MQRIKNIHLGHDITLTAPHYNHLERMAERIATLDLVGWGRGESGTGEPAAFIEMQGFYVDKEQKTEIGWGGVKSLNNMFTITPYPGFRGKYFWVPTRNVIPKPQQKPHLPM